VEALLKYREQYGQGQFLVKCKDYPVSENSWEPVEGLEYSEEMVQEWWTDNMIGKEFTVFSAQITSGFSPTEAGLTEYVNKEPVDKGFQDPYLETDYDSSGSDRRWIWF